MPSWIRRIETALPDFSFSQEEASAKMQEWSADDRERRIVRALYRKSGIDRRHSVIIDFDGKGPASFFKAGPGGLLRGPGTAARNEIFAREARALAVGLARKTGLACPGIAPEEITHVVTVSCTGFVNPGVDYHIVRELGLRESTQRYHLGFMGCYAALPALRMADQFCAADPGAAVLVLSVELCSLHLQLIGTEDQILANSLFSDGAGAAIVSAREPAAGAAYRIDGFQSTLVPGGEAAMAWRIGDHGFDIALSSYVPRIIGESIRGFVEPALARCGTEVGAVDTWAVHPGGKAIIDQVACGLELAPGQVEASREVLRRHGNMSSASILFVLEEILRRRGAGEAPARVCAVAFGPGLTVELALLQAVGGTPGVSRGASAAAPAAAS